MNFIRKLDKTAGRVWKILAYILAFLMLALVIIVFWQVICRFILKISTLWQAEISTIIFIWATYLGAALAIRAGSQISMTLLINKSHKPVREIIMLIAAVITEVIYVVFTFAGIAAVQKFASTTTSGLRLPMPVVYWSYVVSGVIMILFGIGEIIKPILSLAGKSLEEPDTGKEAE